MKNRVDIAVILVGFNSWPCLSMCLESLRRTEWGERSHRIVYVDNASEDGSEERVREVLPEAIIIANKQNLGFCKACNQGVSATGSRYIYLLNVDTLLFRDSVSLLADFLDKTPAVGAVANRLLNPDGTDQWSARRFPTWRNALFGRRSWLARQFPHSPWIHHYLYKDELVRGKSFAVDWVPGSCTLVRREAYESAGGLPEDMHYWSDAVFCERLRKLGWEIVLVPEAKLIHFESHGTGRKSPALRRRLITDFHQGAYVFYCEHYKLGPYNPVRWIAKVGLGIRAGLLLAADSRRRPRVTAAMNNGTGPMREETIN